ncbi:unnamed protein product [Adineta steineri]|uniref:Apple domain-containing protein n=1 Tax=Adineta steineri TaxID=433720 RepID=A0A813ZR81_9BILA|nr:unnamed protein product [Adineta steineri]
MHLSRVQHVEIHETRKLYLNSLQSLLMALHPSEKPEQKSLYLEKYRILIQAILTSERKDTELQPLFYKGLSDLGTDFPSEYIERLLQMQYNSKLYPELLKNMINFTGVRLSKFNTELELPVDTTDLDDHKEAETKLAEIVRILSCIYIITILFSINTAQSYFVEDFDNTYDQRDASISYLRQLLKRLQLDDEDNLQWRKKTNATPKKCKEIKSRVYYTGDYGPAINNLATYQDCMSLCEKDSKCYGWAFGNTTNKCVLQTSLNTIYGDKNTMSGSCLSPAAKEKPCKEVLSGFYYSGTNGVTIKQVATYQDCMSQCDATATCMAWKYQTSDKTCQLQTIAAGKITNGKYIAGSCIKKQAPYPPKKLETSTHKAPSPSTTRKTSTHKAPPPPPPISLKTYRQQALDQHNFYRAKHCTPSLVIDPALNDIAQTYAQKLADLDIFDHSYNKFNGQPMGENLFATGGGAFFHGNGSQPVGAWYNEIKNYNWSKPGYKGGIGHFTQVIWKGSTKLGIGKGVTRNNSTMYVVGNYFPAGNYIGAFEKNVLPLC